MADQHEHDAHEVSLTQPVSAPDGHKTPDKVKADSETLGETSGGFLGGVGGMALGALGGPVGLVIGGLAGALGGWWAGREIAGSLTEPDDAAFQAHYASSPDRLADRSYDGVRPAYAAGHLAGRNPDYAGRSFDQVEEDLRRGWNGDTAARHGEWPAMRGYARAAFDRARTDASKR